MELKGIEAAGRSELVRYAAAIADNGASLLADAELLLQNGRIARAYALAALAIEEFGKAAGVITLAVMPVHLRRNVPVRELLEQHLVKQIGGLILAVLQLGATPGIGERVDGSQVNGLARLLSAAETQARDTNQKKLLGLYAEMEADTSIWDPGRITETEAKDQIARARDVSSCAGVFKDPTALEKIANPPPEELAVSEALFSSYFSGATPADWDAVAQAVKDAVNVVLKHFAQVAKQQTPDGPAT
jgi:AbiV family abortive infection protein